MQNMNEILRDFKGKRGFGHLADLHVIRKSWSIIVGDSLAKQTFVYGIKGKKLIICARSATWVSELKFLEPQILERVQKISRTRLQRLEFRNAPEKVETLRGELDRIMADSI